MSTIIQPWLFFVVSVFFTPIFVLGTIRKTKARLQNRIGPPLLQPLFDLLKLCRKSETLSKTMCGVFRLATVVGLADMLLIAWIAPWLCFKPSPPSADLFLIFYLFAMARMFLLLGALDSGSAFGAFGASRDATLALMVEPAGLLGFVALGAVTGSSDLQLIFSFSNTGLSNCPGIWLAVGVAVLLASLVELSRMPVDDPTTHLELTMVHEAMILEASGRNLALIEFAHALRMTILFGLSAQCFMRAIPQIWNAEPAVQALVNLIGILLIAAAVGVFESLSVKLHWRKVPEFIAYSLTMSLLATLIAVGGGLIK
jgi:formate hydrogenlyase subunit 4